MKKYLILMTILCLFLLGCAQKDDAEKGGYDLQGNITKIDPEEDSILIEDLTKGLTWISLHENEQIENYKTGQKVAVWIDGAILTSSPAFAKALHIEILEETKTVETSLPEFNFEQNEFPPAIAGFVTIDGTRYPMAKGSFKWTKGNQTVQTDALAPTQIAENFKAITVKQSSKAFIEIDQNPNLKVYVWEYDQRKLTFQGTEIPLSTMKGRTIYEAVATWSNGEVSFTFVIDIN